MRQWTNETLWAPQDVHQRLHGQAELGGHGTRFDQHHHHRVRHGVDHDFGAHACAHGPQMQDGLGHALQNRVRPGHIVWFAADQKGNVPHRHTIDLQVCFWKAKRPVRVPSRFLRSSAQKALTPFQDAWQSTPEPSPLLPSTAQIP